MVWHQYPTRRVIALALIATAIAACNSTTNEPNVSNGIAAVSGNDQFAPVGSSAANPLIVLVVDQNGSPFPGATVRWAVVSGGGTVSDTTTTSDAGGHTSIGYTAGTNPGVATISATADFLWQVQFKIHVVTP